MVKRTSRSRKREDRFSRKVITVSKEKEMKEESCGFYLKQERNVQYGEKRK